MDLDPIIGDVLKTFGSWALVSIAYGVARFGALYASERNPRWESRLGRIAMFLVCVGITGAFAFMGYEGSGSHIEDADPLFGGGERVAPINMRTTVVDLGRMVKQKYPGAYDDMADDELGRRVKLKYPGAYDDFIDVEPTEQERIRKALRTFVILTIPAFVGVYKGQLARIAAREKAILTREAAMLDREEARLSKLRSQAREGENH